MPDDHVEFCDFDLEDAIKTELKHIRQLGSKRSLVLASSNLGAYEALLMVLREFDEGLSVTRAIEGVQSPFCSQSGLSKRLRVLRNEGLIEDRVGKKGSEVRLTVSQALRNDLIPVILGRHLFLENAREQGTTGSSEIDAEQFAIRAQILEKMYSMRNRQVRR